MIFVCVDFNEGIWRDFGKVNTLINALFLLISAFFHGFFLDNFLALELIFPSMLIELYLISKTLIIRIKIFYCILLQPLKLLINFSYPLLMKFLKLERIRLSNLLQNVCIACFKQFREIC